jgi:hypothetical protein
MTSGIGNATSTLPPYTAFLISAFLAGFSGLSVCLQLLAVSEGTSLPIGAYLGAKTVQGVLCLWLAALYLQVCRPVFKITEAVFYPLATKRLFPYYLWYFGILSAFLSVWIISERVREK